MMSQWEWAALGLGAAVLYAAAALVKAMRKNEDS